MNKIVANLAKAEVPINLSVVEVHTAATPETTFLEDVVAGLSAPRKSIPAKYFYDRRGSELFDAICKLPEYYPTRTEMQMLRSHAAEIAAIAGPNAHLIEFGSGASTKVRMLLDALETPATYLGVDISSDYLLDATQSLAGDYPDLSVFAICADFTQPFPVPAPAEGTRVGFFPGSTIGNLTHDEARNFLANAATVLQPGGVLIIGVDLKKDPDVLHAAYNDTAGVTAAFNLNLLTRINRELKGTFTLNHFSHDAFYNAEDGRIEMHLRSLTDQEVRIDGHTFAFQNGESIHTENSHKYAVAEFLALAKEAGLTPRQTWVDANNLFSIHALAVP